MMPPRMPDGSVTNFGFIKAIEYEKLDSAADIIILKKKINFKGELL